MTKIEFGEWGEGWGVRSYEGKNFGKFFFYLKLMEIQKCSQVILFLKNNFAHINLSFEFQ